MSKKKDMLNFDFSELSKIIFATNREKKLQDYVKKQLFDSENVQGVLLTIDENGEIVVKKLSKKV
jgi:hypothetical protein